MTNAALIEEAFYSGKDLTPGAKKAAPEKEAEAGQQQTTLDPELLTKLLSNPELVSLLNTLAKSLK